MKRQGAVWLSTLSAFLVLLATLWPASGDGTPSVGPFMCLLCGTRGTADAILNTVLFLPFGAGIGALGGLIPGLVASFFLSGLVEGCQLLLPGRHPALADLVFNTLGGGLGALVAARSATVGRALFRQSPTVRGSSILPVSIAFILAGLLLSPKYPESIYYGQWTHDLGGLPRYEGEVLEAFLGGDPVPDGRQANSGDLRTYLARGDSIRFSFSVADPTPSPRHLFGLFDDGRTEVFLFIIDGPDLLFSRRTLAGFLGLDQPTVRWRGVLSAFPVGETVSAGFWQGRRSPCLSVGLKTRCDLAGGVEGGWRLLLRLDSAPPWIILVISILWVATLSLPVGFGIDLFPRALLSGLVIGSAGMVISWQFPALSPQPVVLFAAVLGVVFGWWLRRRMEAMYLQERGKREAPRLPGSP